MEAQTLAEKWLAAKAAEEVAKNLRLSVEAELLKVVPAREEGTQTTELGNGMRIKTTGKMSYKGDIDLLKAITSSWPEEVRPIRAKLEVDEPLLRAIRTDRPDLWAVLSKAVSVKPAKTYIVVEATEH
ncbi:hypothetical protein UFOVP840_16 [uncultured Caudovirales phage]|uniref:Uncharacterized protein n=1 Tax=uncultured Caudovirales phage TaxID=2100421 RepID=A0A6J5P414_9CAUD|nr:hypothetical protein UFOVP840_16 [uncultured Caudovirales phage]